MDNGELGIFGLPEFWRCATLFGRPQNGSPTAPTKRSNRIFIGLYLGRYAPKQAELLFPFRAIWFVPGTTQFSLIVALVTTRRCKFFPHWHNRNDGRFLDRLTNAGVTPEQIDYVLCTHLHIDHCGWNTRLVDGRWVPTFPNACYIMARREFEAAQAASGDTEERTYEDNVLPIVEAGRAVLVEMDHALDDEVWLEPTPGHTAGHVAIRVIQVVGQCFLVISCIGRCNAYTPSGTFGMTQTLTKPVGRGRHSLRLAQIVALSS